jgi:hypothetical protein
LKYTELVKKQFTKNVTKNKKEKFIAEARERRGVGAK